MVCCTPSMRSPRRACRNGCFRKLCASCQAVCPCLGLPTDWCVPGVVAIEVGRYDKVTVERRDGDQVVVSNMGWPRVERTVDVSTLARTV